MQAIIREVVKTYPRLLDLEIYVLGHDRQTPHLVASKNAKEMDRVAANAAQDVIRRGVTYYGKGKKSVAVTMPLRDRNGDPVAAARVIMETFLGQTEQNALVRATPIVKDIEGRMRSLQDPLQ
jgi:hypothetical protein